MRKQQSGASKSGLPSDSDPAPTASLTFLRLVPAIAGCGPRLWTKSLENSLINSERSFPGNVLQVPSEVLNPNEEVSNGEDMLCNASTTELMERRLKSKGKVLLSSQVRVDAIIVHL